MSTWLKTAGWAASSAEISAVILHRDDQRYAVRTRSAARRPLNHPIFSPIYEIGRSLPNAGPTEYIEGQTARAFGSPWGLLSADMHLGCLRAVSGTPRTLCIEHFKPEKRHDPKRHDS